MRSVVVLPQPEGPSSEMNSPLSMRSEMPFTTAVAPYALCTSFRWTSAIVSAPSFG